MRWIPASFAAVSGVLSGVGTVLFAIQVHATRLFVRRSYRSEAGSGGISYARINAFGGLWLLVVLVVLVAIVTLVVVRGRVFWLSPVLVAAVLFLVGSVVLDYAALSTTPGGFGTEFPHNASGPDAQFDSWGGSELERAVWLTAAAAAISLIAAALIAFRASSNGGGREH